MFYRGQIADLIAAEMERGGGLITKDDLRRYRPHWRSPITLSYRGRTIISMPPASSGGVTTQQTLGMVARFELPDIHTEPARAIHLFAEANRLANEVGGIGRCDLPEP